MFKLVVLSAIFALAAARPGVFHGDLSYAEVASPIVAYEAPAVSIPTAVSHQSRVDVISKPVVATYTFHTPLVATAPAVVSTYAVPAVTHGEVGHVGLGYSGLGHVGLGYSKLGHSALGYGGGLGYAGYGYRHGW